MNQFMDTYTEGFLSPTLKNSGQKEFFKEKPLTLGHFYGMIFLEQK
jgi:hypothetical protein